MNLILNYNDIKSKRQRKYIAPTGCLAHNPTGYLVKYLMEYAIKVCHKRKS